MARERQRKAQKRTTGKNLRMDQWEKAGQWEEENFLGIEV